MSADAADDPVFREVWEAPAFALLRVLGDRGLFTPTEWASALGGEIKKAQATGDPDAGDTSYSHVLGALAWRKASPPPRRSRDAWAFAAERTPRGRSIELSPEDFA